MSSSSASPSNARGATVVVALLIAIMVTVGWRQWAEGAGAAPLRATHAPEATQVLPLVTQTPDLVDTDAVPHPRQASATPHLAIKSTPATITAYDGTSGTVAIDHAALMALKVGDYVVTHLGEHTVVHRVTAREVREDHAYLPMDVVDPMTGRATGFHGAYHAYEGDASYYFNSPHGGFDVRAAYGKPTRFGTFPLPPGAGRDGHGH